MNNSPSCHKCAKYKENPENDMYCDDKDCFLNYDSSFPGFVPKVVKEYDSGFIKKEKIKLIDQIRSDMIASANKRLPHVMNMDQYSAYNYAVSNFEDILNKYYDSILEEK